MLYNLKINNIAIIKEADIEFTEGLNIMTGETGAGKSIIIDAINAILGERTSRELIRTGSDNAEVQALFTNISTESSGLLLKLGIKDEEDGSILLYRKMTSDGKNLCKINGQTVTVSMLKSIGQTLINIHGQLDNHNLLNEEIHCTYIDKYAENDNIRNDYLKAYNEYLYIKKELDSLITDEGEKQRKIDLLTYQIQDIESAGIVVGEKEQLENRRKVLQNTDTLLRLINSSIIAIDGDDSFKGVGELISNIADNISKASAFDDELSEMAEKLTDISYTISDISSELNRALYELDTNPNELNEIEERLDDLGKILKKYGESEEEVLNFLNNAKEELTNISLSEEIKEKLEIQLEQALINLQEKADILTNNRNKIGNVFIKKISEQLKFLDMESINFKIINNKKSFDESGQDDIYFLVSANKGEEPKPLSKVASGGELSRIMLAIQNVISEKDNIQTLIFDEIDTGVSGRAAQKIGTKLKEVSTSRQVLCVTHLAQIAAFANSHFQISKSVKNDKTYTNVQLLDNDGRIYELARIIGGVEPTKRSLDAAAELIENSKNYS